MQIYYNLLPYRHEGFTGEYATRKIQTASRVAQASEDEQHLRCSPQFVCVLPCRFRAKQRLLAVWDIFQIVTCDDIDHIIYFPAFSRLFTQTVSLSIIKNM